MAANLIAGVGVQDRAEGLRDRGKTGPLWKQPAFAITRCYTVNDMASVYERE